MIFLKVVVLFNIEVMFLRLGSIHYDLRGPLFNSGVAFPISQADTFIFSGAFSKIKIKVTF